MSPRTKQQNEQIKEDRRTQILDAALVVFARRGLAATKIGDIATQAGLSHGLVYHYFPSKEDIFTELISIADRSSSSALLQAEQMPLPPMEKLRAIAQLVLQSIWESSESACMFYLMAQAMMSDNTPPKAKEILAQFGTPYKVLTRIIAQGQDEGAIAPGDAGALAKVFWAMIQGLATYRLVQPDTMALPDVDILMRLFVSPSPLMRLGDPDDL